MNHIRSLITSDREELLRVGELFTLKLYAAHKDVNCINKLRFVKFNQINARRALNKEMDLSSLPPTKGALKQHLLRVYYQIQQWCGTSLNPLEWGWTMNGSNLVPNGGVGEVAPKFVLEMIFCNCKKSECLTLCSCKKFGLRCTAQCGNCCGLSCLNKKNDEDFSEIE